MCKRTTYKIVVFLLSLSLLFSIAGCSGISTVVNNGIAEKPTTEVGTEPSGEISTSEVVMPSSDEAMEAETEPSSDGTTEVTTEDVTQPSTEESTTQAPTTQAPTTQPPTTQPPTTQAPTTQAPTTQAPTTQPPTTQPPTTQAPTTQPPTTQPPTTSSVVIGDLTFTEHSYSNILVYTAMPTKQEIDEVRRVLATIVTKNMSDVQKIKAVHDWLVKHTTYEYGYYDRTNYRNFIYNLMFNKAAVCQGYTVTFYVMMTELGIPCTIVGGTGNGGGHAWNAVKLDGYWYFVDVTWDDPLLNGTSTYPNGENISYQYLLCTYSNISKDHADDENIPVSAMPVGTSNKYNDMVYEMSGVTKIIRISSMEEIDAAAAMITETGEYVILLENATLDVSAVLAEITEKMPVSWTGASYSDTRITLKTQK